MNKALDDFKDVMSVTDAQVKLQLASQDDCLNGMSVRLLPHQIIGVSWMVDQEKDSDKNGGILADAMGNRLHRYCAPSMFSHQIIIAFRSRKGTSPSERHLLDKV